MTGNLNASTTRQYMDMGYPYDNATGALLAVRGADYANNPGGFELFARKSDVTKSLIGCTDGRLIWDDKHIVRSVNGVGAGTDGNVSLNLSFLPLSGGTCSGTIYAPAFQISSDIRLKSNLEKIDSALDKVSKIVAYTYAKQGVDGRQAGIIAQDVEKVLPEAVHENDDGYKTVDYSALTALLINAINELRGKLNDIKLS